MKGKTCTIKGSSKYFENKYGTPNPTIEIEDEDMVLWPNGGWGMQQGNPACLCYAVRSGLEGIGLVGKVYYGHIDGLGELVHESELEEV